MGYSLSWAAIKAADPESVHHVLLLRPNGETEEIPEADIVPLKLPNDWYLVLYNKAN